MRTSDTFEFLAMASLDQQAQLAVPGSGRAPSTGRVALAFALVYVLWGSTYLAIRITVEHVPPAMMGATRFLFAGPVMLAWCALTGRKISVNRNDLWRLAIIGVLLLTTGNVVVGWSEQYVPSGLAALIVAIVPIYVVVIEAVLLRSERLSRRGLAGLALGIAGMILLLWPKLGLMLASLSWASGSILSHRWKVGVGPLAATGWQMTASGIVNLAIVLASGDQHRVLWTGRGLAALAYLIVCGSWIGFSAYVWLLNHVPTAKVSTYAYVNPIVAVFLGWLIMHEPVDGFIVAGTVVIVAAVALVTGSKMKPATVKAAAGEAQLSAHSAD